MINLFFGNHIPSNQKPQSPVLKKKEENHYKVTKDCLLFFNHTYQLWSTTPF
jgi:hypothetical protein